MVSTGRGSHRNRCEGLFGWGELTDLYGEMGSDPVTLEHADPPCKRVHPFAEVHGLGGDQHLQIGADGDHGRACRVAITVASVAASTPVGTRTVTAGITISIMGTGTSGVGDGAREMIGPAGLPTGPSISTGTKAGSRPSFDVASATGLGRALLTCRRQVKSRPWLRPWSRPIFETLAPGAKASATIAAFSRTDRARRLLPVIRSRRRSLARPCLSLYQPA